MNSADLRVLCTALGFTAVVMQGNKVPQNESAARAAALIAKLIEEFCRETLPDVFAENNGENAAPEGKYSVAELMATAIIEIYKKQNGCLPHDLLEYGFSHAEVDRHWTLAKALAFVEMNMLGA